MVDGELECGRSGALVIEGQCDFVPKFVFLDFGFRGFLPEGVMSFGRVGGYGIGVGSAGRSDTPAFAEGFYSPIQVIFLFPFLENESSHAVLLVSRRLDPIQPIGRITVSGLGGDVASGMNTTV